jgi:hypothetical protein
MANVIGEIIGVAITVILVIATVEWAMENPETAMKAFKGIGGKAINITIKAVKWGVDFTISVLKQMRENERRQNVSVNTTAL